MVRLCSVGLRYALRLALRQSDNLILIALDLVVEIVLQALRLVLLIRIHTTFNIVTGLQIHWQVRRITFIVGKIDLIGPLGRENFLDIRITRVLTLVDLCGRVAQPANLLNLSKLLKLSVKHIVVI